MASGKAKNTVLSDLEKANAEYDEQYNIACEAWEDLDRERDTACDLITDVESLVESIRNAPHAMKQKREKITHTRETFQSASEIKRKERKEKMGAAAGAVALLGAGAAAVSSFGEYLVTIFEKIFGKKTSKNNILWLAFLIIALLALVIVAISWAASKAKAAREAARNLKKVTKATKDLKLQIVQVSARIQEAKQQRDIVQSFYDRLSSYFGENYLSIPKDDRKDLIAMVNHTEALAKMLDINVK